MSSKVMPDVFLGRQPAKVMPDVFLGRQPILDRNQQLIAYELLFRSGDTEKGNFASFLDGGQATAMVITHAFNELSLAHALGPYQGFVKVDEGMLGNELISALPPQSVVLEILDNFTKTPELIARCEQLHHEGYILATRIRPESADFENPMLKLAEIVKVDVGRTEPERLKQLVSALKPLRKTLLAEKVETHEQMKLCHELGFDQFQGYYFARPTVVQGKRLQSSEMVLLRLLGLISQDADTAEIEKALKQEPGLVVNLLRLTNSAASGIPTKITSLGHAIMILGRRQLLRWLQLLLYIGASSSMPMANPLLQLAATRGRLMELLADHTPEAQQIGRNFIDQAFMVGILSLVPALIGKSMPDVLAQLSLVPAVHNALADRTGPLGDLLGLVESLENEDRKDADDRIQRLPEIDAPYASHCLSRALAWANNLARSAA